MAEDIQFANCARPQVRLSQSPCRRCGNPILNVGGLCVRCMNLGFIDEALQQQTRAFRGSPMIRLTVAKDERRKLHAILIGHPKWAFCGARPNEPMAKRKQVGAGKLPLDLCARCRELVERAWKGATE